MNNNKFLPAVKSTIKRLDKDVVILSDSSVWYAVNLASDLSTWQEGDEVAVSGPMAWSKMTNLRTSDMITVSAPQLSPPPPQRGNVKRPRLIWNK